MLLRIRRVYGVDRTHLRLVAIAHGDCGRTRVVREKIGEGSVPFTNVYTHWQATSCSRLQPE